MKKGLPDGRPFQLLGRRGGQAGRAEALHILLDDEIRLLLPDDVQADVIGPDEDRAGETGGEIRAEGLAEGIVEDDGAGQLRMVRVGTDHGFTEGILRIGHGFRGEGRLPQGHGNGVIRHALPVEHDGEIALGMSGGLPDVRAVFRRDGKARQGLPEDRISRFGGSPGAEGIPVGIRKVIERAGVLRLPQGGAGIRDAEAGDFRKDRENLVQAGFAPDALKNVRQVFRVNGLLVRTDDDDIGRAGFGKAGEGYIRISAFNSRENVLESISRLDKVI